MNFNKIMQVTRKRFMSGFALVVRLGLGCMFLYGSLPKIRHPYYWHVGIGTDFDGGFGLQSVPAEIDTIADLQKLIPLLKKRGYTDSDTAAIMGGNWLDHLKESLPKST